MNFTLRSTSNSSNDNERLTRKRQTTTPTTLNRFLSFNENKSSSAENRRRLLQSTPNLIELLEEDEDDIDDSQELCHECNQCSKVFASEYGLNHHINMHHPNQSILCSLCNITFRSHRSLKTHQQRRHSSNQTKLNNTKNSLLPNYNYISSYLVLPFSSEQFPIMAKNACEQQRLPLGLLSSKLYQCHFCFISFPCIRTLKYHLLNQHEQYEYKICQDILSNLIDNVEYQLRTVNNNNDNDDLASIKLNLSKQASQFGLVNKQLATKLRSTKIEQGKLIYPRCQHESRTCANLCLNYLSSYSKLVQNYPYTIPTIPKGNPFAQGSILSIVPSSINYNNNNSNNSSSNNDTNLSNESNNGRQKRKSIKQTDDASSSPQSKRKVPANSTTTTTSSKPNRTNTNNRINGNKQQNEQTTKTNETKSVTTEQSPFTLSVSPASAIPRKILPKDNYMRSSSMSSNSSTSTRSSMTKSSSSTTNLTAQTTTNSQRTFKRSLSPSITIPLEKSSQKRRRARDQKPAMTSSSSATVIRIDDDDDNDDIEQENDDEEDNNGDDIDDDDDVVPIKFEQEPKQRRQTKQRQASSGSIEYVQTLNNDQQLNNIENLKSKSKVNDEEVIICRSPPSVKKVNSSPNKNHSKTSVNGTKKSNLPSSSNNDEHVRVRCKICGDILEGRSRFSQHVLTMHSHLLKKNISETKQHQTAVVR